MLLTRCAWLPLAALLLLLLLAPGADAATLRVSADGTARKGRHATRRDRHPRLVVDGAPVIRSWVTFRLRRPAGRARLQLFVKSGPRRVPVFVRSVGPRGLRDALHGRRRIRGGGRVGVIRAGRRGHWVGLDVSAATRRKGVVRLLLTTSGARRRGFASLETRHAPRLVLRGGQARRRGGGGGSAPVAPTAPAAVLSGGLFPAPQLPAPTRFVAPGGNDAGVCAAAAPCGSLDRAYHVAAPGEVVQLAGGSYGGQGIQPDPAKAGAGCQSANRIAACVAFQPAAGATVTLASLNLGTNYRVVGPAGIAIVASAGRALHVTGSTTLNRPREVALWNVSQANLFVTGGENMAIVGGEVGPNVTASGEHPEIQRVYASSPLIVPLNLTIGAVYFHDINTTSSTAHVDCLQVENGTGVRLIANHFERCGSVGLRMSWGVETADGPPTNVLIENNVFGRCADIPVSPCYYAAQPGQGVNVLVRNNSSAMGFQAADTQAQGASVSYVGNVAQEVSSCRGSFSHNVWQASSCGATDRRVGALGFVNAATGDLRLAPGSPARNAGDPASFPAYDFAGIARPLGGAPDAGAFESG